MCWQACFSRHINLEELNKLFAEEYPSVQSKFIQLLNLAHGEHLDLFALAGGTNIGKTWQKNPDRTKKQKTKAILADTAEAFAGIWVINRVSSAVNKIKYVGGKYSTRSRSFLLVIPS